MVSEEDVGLSGLTRRRRERAWGNRGGGDGCCTWSRESVTGINEREVCVGVGIGTGGCRRWGSSAAVGAVASVGFGWVFGEGESGVREEEMVQWRDFRLGEVAFGWRK